MTTRREEFKNVIEGLSNVQPTRFPESIDLPIDDAKVAVEPKDHDLARSEDSDDQRDHLARRDLEPRLRARHLATDFGFGSSSRSARAAVCPGERQRNMTRAIGRGILPLADLRIGDATELPYPSNVFRLVIASTVFTSILDSNVRRLVADEISRVLAKGGALLWYDFAFNNPRNPHVRKVSRKELRSLFPLLTGKIRSVTLAPPLARLIAPWSLTLARLLELIPLLRTHLLAVLVKP